MILWPHEEMQWAEGGGGVAMIMVQNDFCRSQTMPFPVHSMARDPDQPFPRVSAATQ